MKNTIRFKTVLLGASCLVASGMLATPVFAQDAPAEEANADAETIIVTGSRIRRPNLDSGAPISTVAGEEFFDTGRVSVGDVLNEMPQLRSTYSQQNSTRFLGTRGLNLLDLRGLGTQRTLVLVNGRRHVPGDVLNNGVSPDVNTFPTDLIESVDILTGAGSSVYGSDAIAGAVNFKLKQNYDGLQVRGQTGLSKYGDAGNQYISVLAGTNFAEDRGNVAVNVEYAHQSDYYASGRKRLRQVDNFVIVDTDPAGSDGTPDRVYMRDLRSTTISLGGMLNMASGNACGVGSNGTSTANYNCTFLFQPDGSLVPQSGTRVGLAPNGSFVGGNGYRGREGKLVALSPELNRFSVNLIGHFEFSPAFVPFIEAKYVRTEAQGSQSGPFFSQGATLGDPADVNREQISINNPYLSAQARDLIIATRTNNGQATTDATRFSLRRNWLDFGIRDEKITRETYRAVLGVRGDFNDDWNYELAVNYGEHREKNKIISNVNVQRYLLAIDTVRDPSTGQIVCRSKIDAAARIAYIQNADGSATDPARLASDVAACQPLNPFGEGSVTQAVRDYVTVDSHAQGKITQFVASGFVSGNLGKLFELPGGPVGFSVGGEYRRETLRYDLDKLTQEGYAFYNAIPSFSAPSFEVKEAYGELSIPLLKNTPFFRELTLSGSGRIADYKGATGTVYTYGGDVVWKPIDDLRLRGSYTRAVRAPNLTELYSAQGQNFAPAPSDPCSARFIGEGSSTRRANCAAAGIPTSYDYVYTASIEILSGGNPGLTEEKSDNFTIGGVYTPSYVPGLSVSVDYYDITVNNVISSIDAQTILNKCYDSPTLENSFCKLFERNGAGKGPNGEDPYQVLQGTLLASSSNFAKLKVRGIDTEVAYRHDFGWGAANFRVNWTHVLKNEAYLDPNDPGFADQALYEVGDPKDRLTANASLKVGKATFGYQFRWIGKQVFGEAENTLSVQGRPPVNADYAEVAGYPNVFYHDVRADYEVNDQFNLYLGVDNVLNRFPPYGGTGIGAGFDNVGVTGLFDNRGRYFYAGFKAKM